MSTPFTKVAGCLGFVFALTLPVAAQQSRCADCQRPLVTLYDALHESRDSLNAAKPMIARVADSGRRAQLEDAYQQAEVPLIQAVQAGHQFVYDTLKERLYVARQRIETLFSEIVNPRPQAATPR